MSLTTISPFALAVGEALAFDVFTRDGALLLSRGSMIGSEDTRRYLLENALCLPAKKSNPGSVFARMEHVATRLHAAEMDFQDALDPPAWISRLHLLAAEVVDMSDEDPDAAFAAMHLDVRHSYDVVHHVVAALVCSRLALAASLTRAERISLVCAALTHDIALLGKRQMVEATTPLSGEARALVLAHSQQGYQMLQAIGVEDRLWLKAVADHHERMDGSGYHGLSAAQLDTPARIITLADSFSAMIRVRPYRDRILAKTALADLYADPEGRYDRTMVTCLVRELGLFPPGSILRLASHEVAIAIRPTPGELLYPTLAAITDPSGRPLYQPAQRNARAPESAIVGLLPPEKAGLVRKTLPMCWLRPNTPEPAAASG